VHGTVAAIGPLMWVLLAVGVLAWAFAVYVIVDALRRRAADFARTPETRWTYVALCAAYAVAYPAYQFAAVRTAAPRLGDVVIVGLLVAVVAGFTYLLRVVFPKGATADPGPAAVPANTVDPDTSEERST
jgi:hypothetical protein